ncbi:MAG: RHS repeat-associated core domain-containing protein, partial [Thermoleophilia bacterium]
PATMRVTRTQDAAGRFFDYTYDAAGNVTQLRDVRAGLVTETRYDALGRPIEQIGPTTTPTSPTAPRTFTQYDRDANGNPWTGLLVRYWNTAGFVGAPADAKVGPVLPGTSGATPIMAFNWTSNPLGGSGPWSARLTGRYKADTDGVYRFANTTSAPMWVNGKVCSPSCDTQLTSGSSAFLQLDVSSADGSGAGINATVQRLDQAGAPQTAAAPIPSASLRPNLNLATASTTNEFIPGQGITPLTSRYTYDVNSGAITASQSPSGATITRTYAPYDPANGQYGEATSITNAAGQTATTQYSKAGTFTPDCTGNAVEQTGLPNGTIVGDASVLQSTAPNGAAVGVSTKGTIQCSDVSAKGDVTVSTIAGTGDTYEVSHYLMIDNNPLHTGVLTGTGGGATAEQTWFDITGTPWKSTDAFGTVTTRDIDPATGLIRSATDTTQSGTKRTTSYTYTPTGDVRTIAIDGKTLLTKTYDTSGRVIRVDYADGTVQTTTYDGTSRPQTVAYLFADGKTAKDTMMYSPTGRRLSRTIDAPDGTTTYTYRYNRDGRLIDTVKTGSSTTRQTGWASTFDGPGGANGNRSSQTITTPKGTTTATFEYGADDRPTSTTKPGIAGTFTADAAGRITDIGGVSIVRDAAGNLQTATEGTKTIALLTDASGGIARGYTDTSATNPITVVAKSSGQGLVLGGNGAVAGQIVSDSGASIVLDAAGKPIRWSFNDQLGNAAWATDASGKVGATRLYSPDGTTIAGAPQTSIKTPLDLASVGNGWQAASGAYTLPLKTPIVQLGSRTYAPDLGRFLEPDPAGSMNAYEYAVGDPINITDPSGQFGIWDLTGAIVATVAGIALGALTFGTGTFAGLGLAGTILLGAAIGAVSGALGNVAQTLVDGTPFDYKQLLLETALGAAFSVVGEGLSAGIAKGIRSFRAWRANSRAKIDARVAPAQNAVDDAVSTSSTRSSGELAKYQAASMNPRLTLGLRQFSDPLEPAALNQVVAADAADVVFAAESTISRGSLAARPNSVNIVQSADNLQAMSVRPDISDTGSIIGSGGGPSRGTIVSARDAVNDIQPGALDDLFNEQADWVVKQQQQQLQDKWKLFMDETQGVNRWKPGDPVPWQAIPEPTMKMADMPLSYNTAKNGKPAWFRWPEDTQAYYQRYWNGLSKYNEYLAPGGDFWRNGSIYTFNESFLGPAFPYVPRGR